MQFETSYKANDNFITVVFKTFGHVNMVEVFERIGGVMQADYFNWHFPLFSTSFISTIIKNTCFVCGGLMKDSTAFKNYDLYAPYSKDRQKVFKNAGEAQLLKVRKCTSCGHSHT